MNDHVYISRDPNYLVHHGIKGQKWGVRNGPPYPLKPTAYSSAEKRQMNAGKMGMSDEAAYLTAYAVAAVGLYAAVALSHNAAEKRVTKLYNDEYYDKRSIKSLAEAPKIDPSSMSMDDHMKKVNPDYPDLGTTENCMFCTTAMAMRMKGYDVKANICSDGWSHNNLKDNFVNQKTVPCKNITRRYTISQLEQDIVSQGEGAYGNYTVTWPMGCGGHSMFYKVENGKVVIYDTQANKKRTLEECYKGGGTPCDYTRLDNVEPTERVLGTLRVA